MGILVGTAVFLRIDSSHARRNFGQLSWRLYNFTSLWRARVSPELEFTGRISSFSVKKGQKVGIVRRVFSWFVVAIRQ